MEKPKKYTFDIWKAGELWYEKESDLPPKGLNALGVCTDEGQVLGFEDMKYNLNTPDFIYSTGEMDLEDFEKIKAEQARLFKLIVDEQVEARKPARIRDLELNKSDKLFLQARLNMIEQQLLAHPRILFNLKRGAFPVLSNLTGRQYKELVNSRSARNKYLAQRPESEMHRYVDVMLLNVEWDFIDQLARNGDTNTAMKTKPANGSGSYMKSKAYVMGDDFFAEANRIYRETLAKGKVLKEIRSSRSGLFSDAFAAKLSDFIGYEARDTQRLNPKKPSKGPIKRVLEENRERWEY